MCPGEEVVLTCVIFSCTSTTFVGRWRVVGTFDQVFFAYNEPLQINKLQDFDIFRSVVLPNYTMISTALLQKSSFAHNNIKMECVALSGMISSTETIKISGIKYSMYSYPDSVVYNSIGLKLICVCYASSYV